MINDVWKFIIIYIDPWSLHKKYSKDLSLFIQLAEKDMMSNTSTEVFKDFLNQAITAVLDPKLNDYQEGDEVISSLN